MLGSLKQAITVIEAMQIDIIAFGIHSLNGYLSFCWFAFSAIMYAIPDHLSHVLEMLMAFRTHLSRYFIFKKLMMYCHHLDAH